MILKTIIALTQEWTFERMAIAVLEKGKPMDDSIRNVPTGWLSPEGKLYECDYYEHLSLAGEIAEKIGASYKELYLADKYLLNNGWVQLSIMMFLDHGWLVTFPESGTISQEQRQFLKPYVEDNMDFIADINADLRIEFAELFYGESE